METPTRILHVFAQMNIGGAETMIMNLYRQIDKSKIQFDFMVHTYDKCAFDDEIESLGGVIYRVPKYSGLNHLIYVKKWVEFMRNNEQHQIIHGHVRSTASIYLKISRKFGKITISHSHSVSNGKGLTAFVKWLFQHSIKNIADYFFACSIESGTWLFGSRIVNSNNFFIVKNSINVDVYKFNSNIRQAIREEFKIENKLLIGHIGRFHSSKNHTYLIDIFYEIRQLYDDSILILIGDGILKEEILKKASDMNLLNHIILTGIRSDVNKLLQAIDILVFPSIYEGLPVTLIEAQASGVKIFASDVVSQDVKLTDNISFISLNKSPRLWAEQILEYKNGYNRLDTSSKIIDAGYDVKKEASWFEEFYISVLE